MSKSDEIKYGEVEMTRDHDNPSARSSEIFYQMSPPRWLWPAVILGVILCIVGLVCIIVAVTKGTTDCTTNEKQTAANTQCEYSPEAKRVKLEEFLKEAQSKYFEMNPDNVAWQPGVADIREHVKNR